MAENDVDVCAPPNPEQLPDGAGVRRARSTGAFPRAA
jgi:hypothetical protein